MKTVDQKRLTSDDGKKGRWDFPFLRARLNNLASTLALAIAIIQTRGSYRGLPGNRRPDQDPRRLHWPGVFAYLGR